MHCLDFWTSIFIGTIVQFPVAEILSSLSFHFICYQSTTIPHDMVLISCLFPPSLLLSLHPSLYHPFLHSPFTYYYWEAAGWKALCSLRCGPGYSLCWFCRCRSNRSVEIYGCIITRLGFPCVSAINNLPVMWEMQKTWVPSLGWNDPLEKGMATHSSILAWEIPWTE